MLEKLPQGIRQSLRFAAARGRRHALHRPLEVDVGVVPFERARELLAQRRVSGA